MSSVKCLHCNGTGRVTITYPAGHLGAEIMYGFAGGNARTERPLTCEFNCETCCGDGMVNGGPTFPCECHYGKV